MCGTRLRHRLFRLMVCGAVLAGGLGCLSTNTRDRPFSEDWLHDERARNELRERQERVESGELVLFGDLEKAHAGIRLDERGKPRLGIGKNDGLSVDVKVGSDSGAKFKYKWEWK